MKPLRLLSFLLFVGVGCGLSQQCQTISAVPTDEVRLAGGKIILDNDGVAQVNGGRAVYTRIKNESHVAVSYWIAVEVLQADKKHYATNCMYRATLPPKNIVVVLGSSLDEPPVPWRVSVTMGPEDSDDELRALSYGVYSIPPKNDSAKR